MTMHKIADKLKAIIETKGPDVLTNNPYQFFQNLMQNDVTDKKTAAAILHTFLMGIPALLTSDRVCGL